MRPILILILTFSLAGCLGLGQKASVAVGTVRTSDGKVVSETCWAFWPIRWHPADTPKTIQQIQEANDVLRYLCPEYAVRESGK